MEKQLQIMLELPHCDENQYLVNCNEIKELYEVFKNHKDIIANTTEVYGDRNSDYEESDYEESDYEESDYEDSDYEDCGCSELINVLRSPHVNGHGYVRARMYV